MLVKLVFTIKDVFSKLVINKIPLLAKSPLLLRLKNDAKWTTKVNNIIKQIHFQQGPKSKVTINY